MTHSYVWHDSFICVTWLIHMCDKTRSYVWHDSFVCVTWLIRMCDMTHSYVWHDSFLKHRMGLLDRRTPPEKLFGIQRVSNPVHSELAHIDPVSRVSGTNQKCTLVRSQGFKSNKSGLLGLKPRVQEASWAGSRGLLIHMPLLEYCALRMNWRIFRNWLFWEPPEKGRDADPPPTNYNTVKLHNIH